MKTNQGKQISQISISKSIFCLFLLSWQKFEKNDLAHFQNRWLNFDCRTHFFKDAFYIQQSIKSTNIFHFKTSTNHNREPRHPSPREESDCEVKKRILKAKRTKRNNVVKLFRRLKKIIERSRYHYEGILRILANTLTHTHLSPSLSLTHTHLSLSHTHTHTWVYTSHTHTKTDLWNSLMCSQCCSKWMHFDQIFHSYEENM